MIKFNNWSEYNFYPSRLVFRGIEFPPPFGRTPDPREVQEEKKFSGRPDVGLRPGDEKLLARSGLRFSPTMEQIPGKGKRGYLLIFDSRIDDLVLIGQDGAEHKGTLDEDFYLSEDTASVMVSQEKTPGGYIIIDVTNKDQTVETLKFRQSSPLSRMEIRDKFGDDGFDGLSE